MPFLGKTPSQIVDPEVDIDGGTIDGVSIGSVTANAGAFTNLTATGTLTLPDDGISGDDVNGGTISNFASTGIDDNATSTAITIDASQNVGIGTNPSPALGTGLHIRGSGYANLTLQKSASNVGHALEFTDENNAIQYRIGTNFASGGQNLLFAYGSTPAIGMMLDSAGKVGIGTSPSNLLHVDKDTGSTPTVYINNSGADATDGAALKVQASGRGSGIADTSIFSVHNISDELFTVRNDGNVGIGTTSPFSTARLQVKTGTDRNLAVQTGTTETSGMKINAFNDAGTVNIPLELNGSVTLLKTGETERLRVDSSGNVSIGTSSIASALFKTDIKGSSTGNFQALRLFNSSDGASATTDLSFCLNRVGSEVLGVAGSIKAGKEQTWTTTPSTVDGYLSFSTVLNETPAERMRIDSSGGLLVGGTTSSTSKIKIAGDGGTYTNYSMLLEGGSEDNSYHAISLMSTGNALGGIIGSNYELNVTTVSQSNTARSSGYIAFGNTTVASATSDITFGGVYKGTAVNVPRMYLDIYGNFHIGKTANTAIGLGHLFRTSGETFTTLAYPNNTLHVYDNGNSAYRFYVSYLGQIYATSTSILSASDATLKENIRDLDKGLDAILALKPRRFDWKNGDGNDIMGFVAQEVEETLPEIVHECKYNDEESKLGLKMGDMIPSLVKAIQEQQAIIEDLQTRLSALEAN